MNTQNDVERALERLGANWPADASIAARVIEQVEANPKPVAKGWRPLLTTRRVAIGGLSAAAVLLAVFLVAINGTTERASAMERMLAKLREVTSFRYKMHIKQTLTKEGADRPVTMEDFVVVAWRAPAYHHEDVDIIEFDPASRPDERETKLLSKIEVYCQPGGRGIFIDHRRKTFHWVPEWPGGYPDYSPANKLLMVKDRAGKLVRDLGSKELDGEDASGFVMHLDGAKQGSGFDALEVWVDPKTDLPIEFSYERATDEWSESYRLFDCLWNIELKPEFFQPKAPIGYTDTTPPTDNRDIDDIVAAFRLFAELSGGKYPAGPPLDAEAIRKEMLQMAGFAGEPHESWSDDPGYQRAQRAAHSLDWVARILLQPANAKYYGGEVEVDDRDAILLWWTVDPEEAYRVFYGDLQTHVLAGDWWDALYYGKVTREMARGAPPSDRQ